MEEEEKEVMEPELAEWAQKVVDVTAINALTCPEVGKKLLTLFYRQAKYIQGLDHEAFVVYSEFAAHFYTALYECWTKMDKILGFLLLNAIIREHMALMVGLDLQSAGDVDSIFFPRPREAIPTADLRKMQ